MNMTEDVKNKYSSPQREIALIIQYYKDSSRERQKEIDTCLVNNASNKCIPACHARRAGGHERTYGAHVGVYTRKAHEQVPMGACPNYFIKGGGSYLDKTLYFPSTKSYS